MKKFIFLLGVICFVNCTKKDVVPDVKQIIINPINQCENGLAGNYPCKDYDLLAFIPITDMGSLGIEGNDCWGWTDPATSKEYALMGTTQGVTFIDISDPTNAFIVGTLPTQTENSDWRDVKVHKNIAYVVSEAANHGMQMFNLRRLAGVTNPPVEFTADRHYDKFGNAHNIVINEESGYAYAVGTSTYSGGPHFIDLSEDFRPTEAGGYADSAYSHDAQVVTYNGPDSDYTGKEILIGSNENEVVIVDVTNKRNPVKISSIAYSNIGYTHQGWFTEDFRYFLLGDELDELRRGLNTRTVIFDFTDLDNPKHHFDYLGPSAAIDHNGYIKGNTFYQASYSAGVRMIDISDIDNKIFREIGFFDTHPENNNTSFSGAWNVYPYFPSGNIIISDINRGLFVIRKKGT